MADLPIHQHGVPFDPIAARAMREAGKAAQEREERLRAQEEAREAAQEREERLRAQEEAREAAQKLKFQQIDDAYYERRTGKSRLAPK